MIGIPYNEVLSTNCSRAACFGLAVLAFLGVGERSTAAPRVSLPPARVRMEKPLLVTQIPVAAKPRRRVPVNGALPMDWASGARIILVYPDSSIRILSGGYHSAADPNVSFDGKRILLSAKKKAGDNWNVYEMAVDGTAARQLTRDFGDCRGPCYQPLLYTIISPQPWYQITFVGNRAGTMEENGPEPATNLYSCKLDGSAVRRLTFNLSSDVDPCIMPDGRLALASWRRSTLAYGTPGRVALFAVNIDGADYSLLADPRGRPVKRMPCVTANGLLVFVESDRVSWDGAGMLSCVRMRRPLRSYRPITGESDGLFHSPSPLPDGSILVSRRPADGRGTHGVYRLDPSSGKLSLVFDDPRYHDVQANLLHPRPVPDGRSSVVTERDPHGRLYCLDVYTSDLKRPDWMPRGVVKRLRVLEGVPLGVDEGRAYLPPIESLPARRRGSTVNGLPPLAGRRILGEIDVERDGSFNVEVPANTPIELQILDANGLALRSCGWIWAKNHEPRGCIGCHEDGESTPENAFKDAFSRPSTPLFPPQKDRRTVDFRRDVMPIIERKCVPCHARGQDAPRLDGGMAPVKHAGGKAFFNRAYENLLATTGSDEKSFVGKYVQPGSARTSPLVWHLFGRNTARPWDGPVATRPVKRIPLRKKVAPLDESEKRTFVEWIDLGALWDGIPGDDGLSATDTTRGERKK